MKETLTHRQLQSLIQVSNVLNSSLDINTVIDSIMEQTISVIDAADGGVLFLYNQKLDILTPKSSHGFKSNILKQVQLKPGESMTGLAFSARQSLIFPNLEEVKRAVSTLSKQNLNLMVESIPTYPFSTICAPIFMKGECIGVITLDSFNPDLQFTQVDINLLNAISHQAAVALEKASLYREKERTVRELEQLNHMISQQNKLLSRSFEIHNNLADLVLNGEGLHSIVKYIHQTIGHPTLLFDDLGELISSAHDTLLPEEYLDHIKKNAISSFESLDSADSITEISIDNKHSHLVVLPIGSKPKLLGSLTIIGTNEISEVDLAALEHASTVISLELVKERAIFDTQQTLKGQFIDELFSGRIDETIIQKAKHLNFDPSRSYIAVMINLDGIHNHDNYQRESIIRHLIQIANKVFLTNQHGLAVRKHDQIIVLLSYNNKVSSTFVASQTKEMANQFQQEILLKNWGMTTSIGVGRSKAGLSHVHKSLQEASKCIQFICSYHQRNKVIIFNELGVQRLLLQNSEEELIDFINEILGPLIEYDHSRKGELISTLFVYLENNMNAKEAAESMHVHTNTMVYRLKRIEEILSKDLTDSEQFLNIHLAAKIYQYMKEKVLEFES